MPGWIHLPADAAQRFPELAGARLQVTGAGESKLVWQVPEPGPAAVRPVAFERVGVCVLDRGAGSHGLERIGAGELEAALDQSLDGGFRLLEALVRPRLRRLAASGGWRLRLPADPE